MSKIYRLFPLMILAALTLGACAESNRPEATGKGNLRGINAVITSADADSASGRVGFFVEEVLVSDQWIGFKDTSSRRIDDLEYTVNFYVTLPGDTRRTRLASRFVDVDADNEYLFTLTGSLNSPSLLSHEFAERQWAGSETVFDARSLHLATTAGDLDLYLVAPGAAPVLGEARATAVYGELSSPFELAAGDYQLVLTTTDDPLDIHYRSRTFSQVGATSVIFSIFDPDPSITGQLSVRAMGAGAQSTELADRDSPPTLRLVHAAFATGNVDLYADDDFTSALVSDLGFGQVAADFDFATGATPVTFTPTGDTGVLLLEDSLTVNPGSRNTAFFVGKPATLNSIVFQDRRRPIETVAQTRLAHVASNVPSVDVYIYPDTEEVADIAPRWFGLPFLAATPYLDSSAADDYLVAVTLPNEKGIIAGPVAVSLAPGDIVEVALLDTDDPNVLQIVVYDN